MTIVTRCHRTDLAVLRRVVGRGAAYVGLIGSRRKIATVLERARALGTPPEALEEIHAPIGVAIGAQTPEEIAVSIAAEMIQIRSASGATRWTRRGLAGSAPLVFPAPEERRR